jgi:hypothetical protein
MATSNSNPQETAIRQISGFRSALYILAGTERLGRTTTAWKEARQTKGRGLSKGAEVLP